MYANVYNVLTQSWIEHTLTRSMQRPMTRVHFNGRSQAESTCNNCWFCTRCLLAYRFIRESGLRARLFCLSSKQTLSRGGPTTRQTLLAFLSLLQRHQITVSVCTLMIWSSNSITAIDSVYRIRFSTQCNVKDKVQL